MTVSKRGAGGSAPNAESEKIWQKNKPGKKKIGSGRSEFKKRQSRRRLPRPDRRGPLLDEVFQTANTQIAERVEIKYTFIGERGSNLSVRRTQRKKKKRRVGAGDV